MYEGGPGVKNFIADFLSKELNNFLHKNPTTAEALKKRIEQNERERKELAGIKKTRK
jgi:topoisomerase-4 subunit B